ncbi:MAG: BamA/OMP85 family outer membrane protein, partial [Opitutales bacterium]
MRFFRTFFPYIFFLFGLVLLWAQVSPDGKKISGIEIQLVGPKTLGESFILQNLQVEKGIPYDATSIDKSIRNLISTGSVEDVRVFLDSDKSDEDEVALIFKVWTKSRIGKIVFEGNKKLSDRKLEKTISLKEGDLLDEATLKEDQNLVAEKYLEKGYWNSSIDVKVDRGDGQSPVSIQFNIVEGEKRTISKILFEGNGALEAKKLLKVMETAPWRFWRFWSKRSKYRPEILEEDLEILRETYRNEGFLDVKIEQSSVKVNPVGKSDIELVIGVQEGKRSFFGKQTVVGNVSIGTDELMGKGEKPKIETGEPYSPTLLSEERNRLRKKYGEKGYLDARVRAIRTPNLETNQIDLRFEITENNKFTVNSIKVRGNEKTKTIAIIR